MAVLDSIRKFAARGVKTVLQLGDFYLGIGSERMAKKRLLQTSEWLSEQDQDWLVTPGNHENWARLHSKRPDDRGVWHIADRVAFLPRGYRWTWCGVSFLSVGGAPSLNRDRLVEGVSWWSKELLTAESVRRICADGAADVLLSHDAPEPLTPRVAAVVAAGRQGWAREAIEYAELGRSLITTAADAVEPRLIAHGHYHVADRATFARPGHVETREVVSLTSAGSVGSAAVLDLNGGPENLTVEII